MNSTEVNLALLVLGGLVIGLGLLSGFLKERLFLSDPVVALLLGVVLSPAVFGAIDLHHWGQPEGILEQSARIAIGIQLMGVALRLPPGFVKLRWRPLAVLLGLVMPLMWLASALLIYLILGLPFWVSMLLGAVISPTDPVVATSIVTGRVAERNLPDRVRHVLSAESGINDGLAYPFVMLPILFLTRSPGEAAWHWLSRILLWEVLGAVILGLVAGYVAGWLLNWAERKHLIDKQSFLAYTLALSLVVLAGVKLMGGDGILAVFAAGSIFTIVVGSRDCAEEKEVQEAVDRLFTIYVFVILGLFIPWQGWMDLGWRGVIFAIGVLLLRRLPAIFALRRWLPDCDRRADLLFMGWFGPIGVAAIFYAMLAIRKAGVEVAWDVASLAICASIVVHGFTAIPLTKFYPSLREKGKSENQS